MEVNIDIQKGNNKSFTLTFTDALNQPIDLSIYENIFLDFSASPIVPTENIKLYLNNGISVNNNVLTISLSSQDTLKLYSNKYWGDLKVLNNNNISTLVKFIFNVEFSSTKVNI